MKKVCWILLWAGLSFSCGAPSKPEPEAVSLLGQHLFAPDLEPERKAKLEQDLSAARAVWEKTPDDPETIIWLGRRTAYLGRYREAIQIFSSGIQKHPEDPRLYRHRGHRYLTLRQFDQAVADLERAAELTQGQPDEIEPDGIPNSRNEPRSTLQFNIWYHLGLAYYLKGDFAKALRSYQSCLAVSKNDDLLVAVSHWLYMTLRRLGREEEAARLLEPVHAGMDIAENGSYRDLLLLYKGEKKAQEIYDETADNLESATIGYGVGNWHFYNDRPELAQAIFRQIVKGGQWASFGYLAAEAELAQ